MQNAHEIRRHISAVTETRKITGAMELISAVQLKKILNAIAYNDIYLERVQSTMKDILLSPHPVTHRYLKRNTGKKRLYIVISADKGMVGSYNDTVLRFAEKEILGAGEATMLLTIGLTANDYFRSRGIIPDIEMPGMSQNPSLYNARRLTETVVGFYDRHEARSVYAVYTSFDRKSQSRPVVKRILPLRIHDYENVEATEPGHEILYVPSANEVFARLVPQYLVGLLYSVLVQSYAGEHFARRIAMHRATENADDMIGSLRLQYNTARQAAITGEIAEISGAAEILKSGD